MLVWLVVIGPLEAQAQTTAPDTVQAPVTPFVPRVSYGLTAGAGISNFGSMSYIEPRVQYRVTPRFHVFSSLTVLQTWGGPTFRNASSEGSSTSSLLSPDRQYLLHVGGTYAMTERLLLTGSVWKDLQAGAAANRWNNNPFTYGRYPNQGFQFKAQYQVSPNVTVSGGVRYSNGTQGYGYGGYHGAGLESPWGF